MMARLSECNSQSLANLAWAQAVVSLGPAEFLPQVCCLDHMVYTVLKTDKCGCGRVDSLPAQGYRWGTDGAKEG